MGARKTGKKGGKKAVSFRCDRCKHHECSDGKDCFGLEEETLQSFAEDKELKRISKAAAKVEAKFYGAATRLEEIALFAKEMGFRHLGVAFCAGFREEARVVCDMLRALFRISSVCCKVSGTPKKALGFPPVRRGQEESICNPVSQGGHGIEHHPWTMRRA